MNQAHKVAPALGAKSLLDLQKVWPRPAQAAPCPTKAIIAEHRQMSSLQHLQKDQKALGNPFLLQSQPLQGLQALETIFFPFLSL